MIDSSEYWKGQVDYSGNVNKQLINEIIDNAIKVRGQDRNRIVSSYNKKYQNQFNEQNDLEDSLTKVNKEGYVKWSQEKINKTRKRIEDIEVIRRSINRVSNGLASKGFFLDIEFQKNNANNNTKIGYWNGVKLY